MIDRAEVAAAKAGRRSHRRLRFNSQLVAEHLDLGPVPAKILDVAGVCEFLMIEREALEVLINDGLPCADINPKANRERRGGGTA